GRRAGLVGTNSVSANRARRASLDYIVAPGGLLTDAASSQERGREARVHASLACWVQDPAGPAQGYEHDGESVTGITASLKPSGDDCWEPQPLAANKGKCFQGPIPVGNGFIISESTAADLLNEGSAPYHEVVRPYLTASDIAESPSQAPSRW